MNAMTGPAFRRRDGTHGIKEQVVLVLQGGGALGAYQAGVYQALMEGGVEPDWVIGTSIGAINGALIAGNEPGQRIARLARILGRRRAQRRLIDQLLAVVGLRQRVRQPVDHHVRHPGFFAPNPQAIWGRPSRSGSKRRRTIRPIR